MLKIVSKSIHAIIYVPTHFCYLLFLQISNKMVILKNQRTLVLVLVLAPLCHCDARNLTFIEPELGARLQPRHSIHHARHGRFVRHTADVTWPVKKTANIDGDITLGG
jgi:hypothetical protein